MRKTRKSRSSYKKSRLGWLNELNYGKEEKLRFRCQITTICFVSFRFISRFAGIVWVRCSLFSLA